MSIDIPAPRITRAHGYHVHVPLAEPTGRWTKRTNFIARLDVDGGGHRFQALGECQPRSRETDDSTSDSWELFLRLLSSLQDAELEFSDAQGAITWVRQHMLRFADEARAALAAASRRDRTVRSGARRAARGAAQFIGRRDPRMPFRGVLFGLETALLDAAARVLGISVAQLLGPVRQAIPTAMRLSVRPDREDSLDLLRRWAHDHPGGTPAWLNLQAGLTPAAARELVDQVTKGASQGHLPRQIVLEQPVGLQHRDRIPALHKRAVNGNGSADVRIMTGGTALWSVPGLQNLRPRGRFGALHIQPASAGGLLASMTLAHEALRANPELMVVLSLHDGTTAIAQSALSALAMALPGLSYVQQNDEQAQIVAPQGPGLGVPIPYEQVVDAVTMHQAFPPAEEPDNPGARPNEYAEVTFLQPLGPNGTKGHLLERQALALGLQTRRFSKGAFTATDGVHDPLLIKWSRSPLSSAVSLALCTHKEATRIRLHQAGVPVPRGRTFVNGDFDSARAFAERIGYPVVVKPAMGVRGIGVVANIQNREELDLAFQQLTASKLGDQDIIVEKHIPGNDYRIVVVGDEVVAAILREPASVVGDGKHTIAELMIHKNLLRRQNPHLWGRPILFDDAARYQLQRVDMTLESVPAKGERVMLSNSNSLSQGGDSTDVLDEMHPSIKEASIRAVQAIPGLAFCGVDFLIEDHTRPLEEQVAGICELNAHAAIGNCEYPLYGKPRQVAQAFMEKCVEQFGLVTSSERAEQLSLKLTIRGRVAGVGYRRWMRDQADTFGLHGWIRNVNGRTVEAVIHGDTEPASALAAAAVLGPRRALPTSVTTTHIDPVKADGFTIRHNPRRWTIRG